MSDNKTPLSHLISSKARPWLLACLLGLLVMGCGREQKATAAPAEIVIPDAVKNFDPKTYKPPMLNGVELYTGPHRTPKGMSGLTLVAYNYTDTYISNFTVNGAGGGNVEVSNMESGNGGGACCAPISADIPLPMTVKVAWQRDGDVPYCRQTVLLNGPIPPNPNAFEVHFYPDGTIQVAITDFPSPQRLNLESFNRLQRKTSSNINNDSKFSECGYVR
jgi:Protein of unknown function (DUF3304)